MTLDDISRVEFWVDESVNDEFSINKKYEQIWEAKDGTQINIEIVSHSFRHRNKEVGVAIARDITERKQAESEIRFVNEELVNQKENLEAIVDNLTQTQEQLVQSEKMAALGQLIAGVAHEVNTPLGAIKASIGNLHDSLSKALSALPSLIENQTIEDIKLFNKVIELSDYSKDSLSSREKRTIRKEIAELLSSEKIEPSHNIADLLLFLNVHESIKELIPLIHETKNVENILKTARNFASIMKNSNTISIAAEKATKVVFALKKYAHRELIEEKTPTDITDSLETVLTLYHNQLKQGIQVVRKFDTLPIIPCHSDELNQVWTNLIHNAIQAMEQNGILTITTRNENDFITIKIADTGCGIEPDIKHRIFEPFFTTKKQGEGSGLGLDIVKKIIEKHNGTITVESELGKGTEFTIRLPIK